VKSPPSKRKQDRENYSPKTNQKIGYYSEDGKDSDGAGHYSGGRREQSHFDKRNKSDSPGWMPKQNEVKDEVKKERTQDPSTVIQDRQGDRQNRMGRNNRDQRPKVQHQKKDWKERSEGYSRGDNKRKRDYSRGDNPSRRIRPPR
jgi:hypothetical protein